MRDSLPQWPQWGWWVGSVVGWWHSPRWRPLWGTVWQNQWWNRACCLVFGCIAHEDLRERGLGHLALFEFVHIEGGSKLKYIFLFDDIWSYKQIDESSDVDCSNLWKSRIPVSGIHDVDAVADLLFINGFNFCYYSEVIWSSWACFKLSGVLENAQEGIALIVGNN